MAWDFQWLVLKIRIVLAQIQELWCMQNHINKVARMAQTAKDGLHHFLLVVSPGISPRSII